MISKKAEEIISKNGLYIPLFYYSERGLILCNKNNWGTIYYNDAAMSFLGIDNKKQVIDIHNYIEEENLDSLKNGSQIHDIINERSLNIKAICKGEYIWIIIENKTYISRIEEISNKAVELNEEYINLFGEYGDENIMIADSNGVILFAGNESSNICGKDKDYFLGKNVYDMEKKGVFVPSVTVRVLEEGKRQIVLQKTEDGTELVSFGTPIFGPDKKIDKIVSVTKNFSALSKVGEVLAMQSKEKEIKPKNYEGFEKIVSCDESMFRIKRLIKLVAPTNSTIFITGDTGTGKEVIARCIYELSKRKDKPFIKVNCGSISPNIVESELFGYDPGSFTGAKKEGKIGLIEAADGGTLFLDEIGELPMEQQVKLLRVLQEKKLTHVGGINEINVDIRVIAATNKNLEREIKNGRFREDLYYRLNVVPIDIPALCERRDDIPLLSKNFLSTYNKVYNQNKYLSREVIKKMKDYNWPGNVRELENTIERLVITSKSDFIQTEELPEKIRNTIKQTDYGVRIGGIMKLDTAIAKTEKQLIEMAIEKYKTTSKAAEVLGVNQSTISRKIALYNIKK